MQGRCNVRSNLSTDSNSTFSQSARFSNAQNPGSSGFSELPDAYQNSASPGSMDKIGSQLAVGNIDRDLFGMDRSGNIGSSSEPEVTQALPKFTEQSSLDGEGSCLAEKLPYCSQNENLLELVVLGSTRGESGHDGFINDPPGLQYEDNGRLLDINTGMLDDLKSMLLLPNSGCSPLLNDLICFLVVGN